MTHPLFHKWFPPRLRVQEIACQLTDFYARNAAYHDMTAGGDKRTHPQVRLLQALVEKQGRYLEVGCGGGAACEAICNQTTVVGIDYSPIAIAGAGQRPACAGTSFAVASAAELPFTTATFDGAYSFEVLEHVWEPDRVIREMARVVRPGGFVLISTPNHFSLDLHLKKRRLVLFLEFSLACLRVGMDRITGQAWHLLTPHLDGPLYPDCDMITSLCPWNLSRLFHEAGLQLEFVDTTYMMAHRADSTTSLRFQRFTSLPLIGYFGDHILLCARKKQTEGL